jgi:hypothetical protein
VVDTRWDIRSESFYGALSERLTEQGWHSSKCPSCGRVFFSRHPRDSCEDVRAGCAPDYGFVARRARVRFRSPVEMMRVLRAAAARLGFTETILGDMLGSANDTFFVIAGVQVFDPVLAGQAPPDRTRHFVPQPSVRVKALDKVGRKPGISSSFVNLCTEELDGDLGDYLRHIEAWFEFFRELGMDSDGFVLIAERELFTRGCFDYRTVNVNYYGFELGEAIALAGDADCPVDTILDFGFCFERIVWAATEADSYFSLIGTPSLALSGRYRLVDFVRTMTLLASAGLRGANQGPGYVLRKLGRLAVEEGARDVDLEPLVTDSHHYWSEFTTPVVGAAECVAAVTAELDRAANALVAADLRLRAVDLNQPRDSFLTELVRKHGIRHDRLRKALQP